MKKSTAQQKNEAQQVVRGYKVTNANGACRGYQYEVGKEYEHQGAIELCSNGFHFCEIPNNCFNYYDFNSDNRVFEIEAYGDVLHGDDKSCCSRLKIIRELTWHEVLNLVNTGSNNTGRGNTGDSNTGDSNTGDSNTGYSNTGDWNTGDRNTGDSNTGYSNTGDSNTGYRNTGDRNTGDSNTGDWNTGDWNTGDSNTGYSNTGYSNTGDRNTGDSNTGYSNTGDSNTGDRNTGDWNTGDWNTGDRNTGYSNTGDSNTGVFCTNPQNPTVPFFNKPSDWTISDFQNSKAFLLLRSNVDTKLWISESNMTDEEKIKHYGYKTAGGFYRDIPFKEAFNNAWHNWNAENRKAFTSLPNFDKDIFFEITGVQL